MTQSTYQYFHWNRVEFLVQFIAVLYISLQLATWKLSAQWCLIHVQANIKSDYFVLSYVIQL